MVLGEPHGAFLKMLGHLTLLDTFMLTSWMILAAFFHGTIHVDMIYPLPTVPLVEEWKVWTDLLSTFYSSR
jgi:hypothetical protein